MATGGRKKKKARLVRGQEKRSTRKGARKKGGNPNVES